MKKLLGIFLISVIILSFLNAQGSAQAGSASVTDMRVLNPVENRITPDLQSTLNQMQQNEMITVIVTLRQQADLSRLSSKNRKVRLGDVVRALHSTADVTQKPLKALLNSRRVNGKVKDFSPLWIINGFSVTADSSVINELAQHPNVLSISPDKTDIIPVTYAPSEANISAINAPALWNLGYTGQGIVVASLDSGVDASHPDLSSRWRGGTNSWFDPYGQHPSTPVDLSGHGTWTMGAMLGGDSGGTTIGVAPDARWIAAKIFNDQGSATATAIHLAFQWVLDPDGNPGTPDAPQVVNNSWTYGNPGCNLEFELDLQSLRAANILPVFAAGNGGPSGNTSFSPSNNPSAFAVGAINNTGSIYAYSSRGPSACAGDGPTFPDVVAPGVNIHTTDLYGGYFYASGTSLSTPHVTGALALLLSAYPDLSATSQENALTQSAVDRGVVGPDNVYGKGSVDALAAFNLISPAQTATPTDTLLPETPTDTPLPDTPTPSATPLPDTATPTETPLTDTATPTSTPLPDTATPIATPLPDTATPTATPLPDTATPTETPTSTPTPTNTPTQVPPTLTPSATATATQVNSIHVGDLDRTSVKSGLRWNATVTIRVHKLSELPAANVTVSARWTNGATGTASCKTNASGVCAITRTGINSSVTSVTFTVTQLTLSGYSYSALSNHDPDGDSNGTMIVVTKP
jgi:hypothetical protein